MKIDVLDKLVSKYVRTRDNWTCQRCFTQYTPPTTGLQCSHFFGRTMKSVRYDELNCDALCYFCHRYWEKEDREGYRAFKLKQLGEKGFNALMLRAHQPGKPDRELLKIYYRQKLKLMEKS